MRTMLSDIWLESPATGPVNATPHSPQNFAVTSRGALHVGHAGMRWGNE